MIGPEGVEHDPYGQNDITTPLLAVVSDNAQPLTQAKTGDRVGLVMASTPFYVESAAR